MIHNPLDTYLYWPWSDLRGIQVHKSHEPILPIGINEKLFGVEEPFDRQTFNLVVSNTFAIRESCWWKHKARTYEARTHSEMVKLP